MFTMLDSVQKSSNSLRGERGENFSSEHIEEKIFSEGVENEVIFLRKYWISEYVHLLNNKLINVVYKQEL